MHAAAILSRLRTASPPADVTSRKTLEDVFGRPEAEPAQRVPQPQERKTELLEDAPHGDVDADAGIVERALRPGLVWTLTAKVRHGHAVGDRRVRRIQDAPNDLLDMGALKLGCRCQDCRGDKLRLVQARIN